MSTKFSIGQMNQLAGALERAGFTPEDVTKLQQYGNMSLIKAVLDGTAKIEVVKHVVDCDIAPFVPDGWSVEEHIKGGQLEWNADDTELFLHELQKSGKSIEGNKLRKVLAGKRVLNANVLDFLLAHPELIPEEWKGKFIFFWGTIYRRSDGNLYVRCLYWGGVRWYWDYRYLDDGFHGSAPAALCK